MTVTDRSDTPALAALQARWDAFLVKIEARFHAVLEEAEPALLQIIYDDPGEMEPLMVAWNGIRRQLSQLIEKVDETWTETVGPQMEAIGWDGPGYDYCNECDKGRDLQDKLRHALARANIEIMGKAGVHVHQTVLARADLTMSCSQCAAPLHVTTNIYRSHYQNCAYCKTVNTYSPASELREVEWFAMDNIAAYHCLEEWEAIEVAEAAYSAQRRDEPETVPYETVAAAHRAYYTKYFAERVKIVPEFQKTLDEDIENKLKWLEDIKKD